MSRILLVAFLSMLITDSLRRTPHDRYDGTILKADAAETAKGKEQTKNHGFAGFRRVRHLGEITRRPTPAH